MKPVRWSLEPIGANAVTSQHHVLASLLLAGGQNNHGWHCEQAKFASHFGIFPQCGMINFLIQRRNFENLKFLIKHAKTEAVVDNFENTFWRAGIKLTSNLQHKQNTDFVIYLAGSEFSNLTLMKCQWSWKKCELNFPDLQKKMRSSTMHMCLSSDGPTHKIVIGSSSENYMSM